MKLLPCALATLAAPLLAQEPPAGLERWSPAAAREQAALEEALLAVTDAASLRRQHDVYASRPHDAGTEGDAFVIDTMAKTFEELGLEVERHEFWAWLARPVRAELAITAPEPMELPVREVALAEDPYSQHNGLTPGWNAFSGSGRAEGEVVYANYGRKQDFERLAELGVSCEGRVVVCRYGGNYRGYKAKFAEAAGAAGLVIFTDPGDSGYARGLSYPEGGWANDTQIQRGSIKTLSWYGDPLTPFVEATRGAERLDPDKVDLPKIPVQPVGWRAAQEILSRMKGASVPGDWQGGLPFRYRLTGGPELRVAVHVEQERKLTKSYNVVGTLRGAELPEQHVIVGCHHDAWGFGAADPTCGLICVMEAARAFAEAAEQGHRPRRTVKFAGWGAEEHGIIGSVEWVEARLAELRKDAVAYVNLDMAAMGPRFGTSCSPSLQGAILGAAQRVRAARGAETETVADRWKPAFGDLGGGSDHVGFIALASVPCASLSGRGADGVAYHSAYDTLAWYRKIVGADYEPARMVTDMATITLARLAGAPVLPLNVARHGTETQRQLDALARRVAGMPAWKDGADAVVERVERLSAVAARFAERAAEVEEALADAVRRDALSAEQRREVDRALIAMDRAWLHEPGIPDRPWFQSLYAATDQDSGYAAWMLPGLRYCVETGRADLLDDVEALYAGVFERLGAQLDAVVAVLERSS